MLFLLAACNADHAEIAAPSNHQDSGVACDDTLLSSWPQDQDQDIPTDSTITISFASKLDKVGVNLSADYDGYMEDHPVQTAWDGSTLLLTPTHPLTAATHYQLDLTTCNGLQTLHFTTAPLPSLDIDITGYTYAIQLDHPSVTWIEPAGLGPLLMSFYEVRSILFSVQQQDDTRLDLIAAAAWTQPLRQYPCTAPIDLPPSDFTANPRFSTRIDETEISFGGESFSTYNLGITGQFSPDGERMEQLTLSALIDTTGLEESYGIDLCDAAVCEPCPNEEDAYCLNLVVTTPGVDHAPDIFVEDLDAEDFSECQEYARISRAADPAHSSSR